MPKLSIIIPVYNVQHLVEKCILSITDQKIPEGMYEILLINDGSTDKSLEVIQVISKKHPNVVKVFSQDNSGLGATRNKGINLAKGDYIWFVDSDDYLENQLPKILKLLSNNAIDVLALNYNVVDTNGNLLNTGVYRNPNNKKDTITGAEFYLYNYAKSYSCMFIFKRQIFSQNQLRFKERINMQDSEIFPKIMHYTKRLMFFNTPVYNYVQHPNSFTNSNNPEVRFNYFKSIVEVKQSLYEFAQQNKISKDLYKGIALKQNAIDKTILDHILFFNYEKKWFKKIILYLKANGAYPFKYKAQGKFKYLKIALNTAPYTSKLIIDTLQKLKNILT